MKELEVTESLPWLLVTDVAGMSSATCCVLMHFHPAAVYAVQHQMFALVRDAHRMNSRLENKMVFRIV